MSHDFFSKKEMTEEEIVRKRIILKSQVRKIRDFKLTLECPVCEKTYSAIIMYKCFECGIWYCVNCAKQHFYGILEESK